MTIDPRTERKLGALILETIGEIQTTPTDNVTRFLLLKKKLEKQTKRYTAYTGSEYLLHEPKDYGFETSHHGKLTA